ETYSVDEGGTLTQTGSTGWLNPSWKHRQLLTVSGVTFTAGMADTPLLVKLHATATDAVNIDYGLTQNAGQDLRFVDTSGNLLAYEIESWNESGYSYVWVQLPASSGGSLWMYYDNPLAPAGQTPTAVWGTDSVVVAHLNNNFSDSSGSGNNGTASSTTFGGGISGNSAVFNGSSSTVHIPAGSSVDNVFVGGATASAWINPAGWGEGGLFTGYGRILDKASGTFSGSNADGWNIELAGSGSTGYLALEYGFSGNEGKWHTPNGSIQLNQWQQITVVYDATSSSNTPKIYINGVEQSLTRTSTPSGTPRSDAGMDLTIGNFASSTSRTFDGRIEEVRITKDILTAAEITAQYRLASAGFLSSGPAQTGPAGLLANDSDAESSPLTTSVVTGPTHAASFTLNTDGSFTYVHDGSETTFDSFTYAVTDADGAVATATATLTINPVNDAPTSIQLSNKTVAENSPASIVGLLSTTDSDPGDTSTYSVSDTRFTISGGALQLKSGVALDFETEPTISLTVTSTDSGGLSVTRAFTLNVLDRNDAPTGMTLSGGSVAENSAVGTVVGQITAIDPDAVDSHTWSIVGGNAGNAFAINATTGVITVRTPAALDFETATSIAVGVRTTDSGGATWTSIVTIQVTNANELFAVTAPISVSIAEDSGNHTYSAVPLFVDPDAGDTATYEVLQTTGPAGALSQLVVNSTTGEVNVTPGLNYNGTVTITVRATDSHGLRATKNVELVVTPVNDAPVINPFTIRADFARTLTITQTMLLTSASDIDGDALTATIIGNPEFGTLINNGDGTWTYSAPSS
ncbi:MAG: DUF2341 domain-containing protein, partial [Planctomycetaceae bacterium]|nr:DUF2341 domain-containing protein [Planctomycetaceae bacterium]